MWSKVKHNQQMVQCVLVLHIYICMKGKPDFLFRKDEDEKRKTRETNRNQGKKRGRLKPIKIRGNQWKQRQIIGVKGNRWKSTKTGGNQRKPMEFKGNQCKIWETNENLWNHKKPMGITGNH